MRSSPPRFGTTLLAVLLVALPALAQPVGEGSSAGDRAVELGRRGLVDFQQGKWRDAYVLFAQANALSASPVFDLFMGRSLRNDGKLLDARTKLRALVATPVPEGSPATWSQARDDARAELTALEPRIPSIVVAVRGTSAPDVTVTVTVDGAPANVGAVIELDPGTHRVRARGGAREVEQSVDVVEGTTARAVTLDLSPASVPPSEPRWTPGGDARPRRAPDGRIALEAVVAGALTPSFGGPVTSGSGTIGAGAAATLHADYSIRSHVSLGLALGGLLVAQEGERSYAAKPFGAPADPGTLHDDLALRAAVVGGTIGLHLGDRVPLLLRLGTGVVVGSMTDTRRGTFQSGTSHEAYDSGTLTNASGATFFQITPEARVGYRFADHLEGSVGLAVMVLLALGRPRWDDDRTFSAGGVGEARFPEKDELTGGAIVLFVPGLGVRYEF